MDFQEIIAGTVGKLNTFGTCVGRVKAGAMSFARYSTDDRRGVVRGYTGAGPVYRRSAGDVWRSGRGGDSAAAEAAASYICREGFEHHVAANFSDVSKAVHEAARYLGWESHYHPEPGRLRGSGLKITSGVD